MIFVPVETGMNILQLLTQWRDDITSALHCTSRNCDCGTMTIICSSRRPWPTTSRSAFDRRRP